MIFVTVGTVHYPFQRLLREVLKLYGNSPQQVLIQSGFCKLSTTRTNIRFIPFLPFGQQIQYYKTATLVISAAGEASVFLGLSLARGRIVFVPRRAVFREHVDEQQSIIGNFLKKNKLAPVVFDIHSLGLAVRLAGKSGQAGSVADKPNPTKLLAHLKRITG